jgi:hypothetical protein
MTANLEVARNLGKSVQIIQQYYGKQATAAVFATIRETRPQPLEREGPASSKAS